MLTQRLVRAKTKIKGVRIPYDVPRDIELADRLDSVLTVVYLVFNESYAASFGAELVRADLCVEAIRLGRLLVELLPAEREPKGLLALMLLCPAITCCRPRARTCGAAWAVAPKQPQHTGKPWRPSPTRPSGDISSDGRRRPPTRHRVSPFYCVRERKAFVRRLI
jgi:hypothetical protein